MDFIISFTAQIKSRKKTSACKYLDIAVLNLFSKKNIIESKTKFKIGHASKYLKHFIDIVLRYLNNFPKLLDAAKIRNFNYIRQQNMKSVTK